MALVMRQHAATVVRWQLNQWRVRYNLALLRGDHAEADACFLAWDACGEALAKLLD